MPRPNPPFDPTTPVTPHSPERFDLVLSGAQALLLANLVEDSLEAPGRDWTDEQAAEAEALVDMLRALKSGVANDFTL